MGCIQISVIRSNNISIDRPRRCDPNARMADSDVDPLPRNRFLKFAPSSTNRNSMGRREGKIVPDSPPHVSSCMREWVRYDFSLASSHTISIGTAGRELQKSISRQRTNIWVCHSGIGITSTSSIDRDVVWSDRRNLNTPRWRVFKFSTAVLLSRANFFGLRTQGRLDSGLRTQPSILLAWGQASGKKIILITFLSLLYGW